LDQTTEIQIILIVAFLLFLGFLSVIIFLLVRLITNQHSLERARTDLQHHNQNLEKIVAERTQELTISEEKYRKLFLNSSEGIIIFNELSGEILDVNDEATKLFEMEADALKKIHINHIIHEHNEIRRQDTWEEVSISFDDGRKKLIECLMGSTDNHHPEIKQAICRDITEKRELEVQFIQSQKLADLGLLASGVAHELNNPLNSIYSSAYFLKGELSSPSEKTAKHLTLIGSQIERCRNIIQDLLNFSKAPQLELHLEHTDINRLVQSTLALIEQELNALNIKVKSSYGELKPILIDSTRLTSVIFNLLKNASQAMSDGGLLTVETYLEIQSDDQPKNSSSDLMNIVINISDTGKGIPSHQLSQIFTPFFTTKHDSNGIGLGLSVSYQTIKMFHGSITVDSEENKGTKFVVVLPIRT